MRKWQIFPILLIGLFLLWRPVHAEGGGIVVMDVDGVVSPGMVNYFERALGEAEAASADLVVVQLDTPGGLGTSMLDIVKLIRTSSVPVVIYVGPAGAEAGSAGAIITLAGHVSAMAPETAIGAASPINGDGSDLNETANRKAVEFISAEVRSLTESRPPEAQALAESMISEARAVSANEALEIGLIDLISNSTNELIVSVDGWEVRVQGQPLTIDTSGALISINEITPLERFQMLLAANAELIGILLSVGAFALIVELRAPGGYVAGGVGVICLGLAFYGMGQLPTNYFGLGLIALAFVLFILETKTPTFGILTMIGIVGLVGGLVLLFDTPDAPAFIRIGIAAAIGITLPMAILFLAIARAVVKAQRGKVLTGRQGMIGTKGIVTRTFKPFGDVYRGKVLVLGEIWHAESAEPLPAELPIKVQAMNGFTVSVVPTATAANEIQAAN
jgi:membrane-bound serine protease (ClpP class)